MVAGAPLLRPQPGGVLLQLRVTPNAGADRIEGIEERDDGSTVLRVRVKAPPDRGKANAAVVALLAAALALPRARFEIASGETARLKTIRIAADPAELAVMLATALGAS